MTSIEGDYDNLIHYTSSAGTSRPTGCRRRAAAARSSTRRDGDIARKVAKDAGLKVGDVSDPGVTHKYVAQVAQTDWEFLKGRADEIGYDVARRRRQVHVRPGTGHDRRWAGRAAAAAAAAHRRSDSATTR